MNRDKYPMFMDWYAENLTEYEAWGRASEGDIEPLVKLIEERGYLATREARALIASHLRGETKRRGQKRTSAQAAMDMNVYADILNRQKETGCSEYAAINWYLETCCGPDTSLDTLKTQVKRGKKVLQSLTGK